MQRISVNPANDSSKNQLNYKNDSIAIENKKQLQKPFEIDFLTW